MALEAGYEREELREIREARWHAELQCVLHEHGHAAAEADLHAQSSDWKLQIAARLRARVGAPYRWIAGVLEIQQPASLRTQIRRLALHVSADPVRSAEQGQAWRASRPIVLEVVHSLAAAVRAT